MEFEWDEDKNESNLAKHGIDFEEASRVFLDPWRQEWLDDRDYTEERWQTIGVATFPRVLFVVYTERGEGDVIRIISARKATKREEKAYRRSRI